MRPVGVVTRQGGNSRRGSEGQDVCRGIVRLGGDLPVVGDGGDVGGDVADGELAIAGMDSVDDSAADVLEHDGAVHPDQVAAATAVDAVAPTQVGNGSRRFGHPAIGIGCPGEVLTVRPAPGSAGDETVGADSGNDGRNGMGVVDGAVGVEILTDDDLLQVTGP